MALPVAILVVASVVGALAQSSPAEAAARISVLETAVEWRPAGTTSFEALEGDADVEPRSVVRTSKTGVAELAYRDGSLTRLGPGTSYEITTLEVGSAGRQIVGRIDVGRTFHRVAKVSGSGSRFEVHTSNAVAAVRGTAFAVTCLVRDVCEVAVTHGVVEVTAEDGRTVMVTAGRRVIVGPRGRLGTLETLPPSDPWVASNTSGPDRGSDAGPDVTDGSAPPSEVAPPSQAPGGLTDAPTPAAGGSSPTRSERNPANSASTGVTATPIPTRATGPPAVTSPPPNSPPTTGQSTVPRPTRATTSTSTSTTLGGSQPTIPPITVPSPDLEPCGSGRAGASNPHCTGANAPLITQ